MIIKPESIKYGEIRYGDTFYLFDYLTRKSGNSSLKDSRSYDFLIDFKNGEDYAVDIVYTQIKSYLGSNFSVCSIPSHEVGKLNGPYKLAKLIANSVHGHDNAIQDRSEMFVRNCSSTSLRYGGNISNNWRNTISYGYGMREIFGRDFLIIDDVTTTGNTLDYAEKVLKRFGANNVLKFVVGKTRSQKYNRKAVIINVEDVLIPSNSIQNKEYVLDNNIIKCLKETDIELVIANIVNKKYNDGFREIMLRIPKHHAEQDLLKSNCSVEICLVTQQKAEDIRYIANQLGVTKIYGAEYGTSLYEKYLHAKTDMMINEDSVYVLGADVDRQLRPAEELKMHFDLIRWYSYKFSNNYTKRKYDDIRNFTLEDLLDENNIIIYNTDRFLQRFGYHELYNLIGVDYRNDIKQIIEKENGRNIWRVVEKKGFTKKQVSINVFTQQEREKDMEVKLKMLQDHMNNRSLK